MAHIPGLSVEQQRKEDIKVGVKGFWLLLIVTFVEVFLALFMKDVLPDIVVRLAMIGLSLYKAYYIVSIFMHLGSEVGGFASTIVLPMLLLVWAVIAFLWEGDYARGNRNYVKDPRPAADVPVEEGAKTSMKADEELNKAITLR